MVADFRTDVNNVDVLAAEELVYKWLLRRFPGDAVKDLRNQHLKWDFSITANGREYTLDVKYDRWIGKTQRFPFEVLDEYPNGEIRPTWGVNEQLDYIAAVSQTFDAIHVAPLHYVRSYVLLQLYLAPGLDALVANGWKSFSKPNRPGYVTRGLAVPVSGLKAYLSSRNARMWSIVVPESDRPPCGRKDAA